MSKADGANFEKARNNFLYIIDLLVGVRGGWLSREPLSCEGLVGVSDRTITHLTASVLLPPSTLNRSEPALITFNSYQRILNSHCSSEIMLEIDMIHKNDL